MSPNPLFIISRSIIIMQCPKCNGGSFLSEEELVKHIDTTEPHRVIIKATRTCMSCQEKFSRLVWDELGPHRRHVPAGQMPYQQPPQQQQYQQAPNPYQYPQQPQQKQDEEVVDGLRFF
jgi:hypothetical protein